MKATHAPVFLPTNKGLSAGPEQITKALSFSNGLSSFLFLFMYSVSTAKRGEDRASLVRLVPEAGCLREGGVRGLKPAGDSGPDTQGGRRPSSI